MKASISQINVADRVRKEITKIEELAADIEANGLLNPITVMRLADGQLQLLAGLRRLRAIESIGLGEIDVNVVSPADAEIALRIEVSENEQREPFTFSEKMDFARMLENIEREKALERKSIGGKGGFEEDVPAGAHLQKGRTRDIVSDKIGMKRTNYQCAKYITENAPDDVIEELDKGQRTIRGTYDELRSRQKAAIAPDDDVIDDTAINAEAEPVIEYNAIPDSEMLLPATIHATPSQQQPRQTAGLLSKSDEEAMQKNKDFNALSPQDKIKELQRQLKEERARATHAESELARLMELRQNDIYHKDGIISNLTERLAEAEARIVELENPHKKAGEPA